MIRCHQEVLQLTGAASKLDVIGQSGRDEYARGCSRLSIVCPLFDEIHLNHTLLMKLPHARMFQVF